MKTLKYLPPLPIILPILLMVVMSTAIVLLYYYQINEAEDKYLALQSRLCIDTDAHVIDPTKVYGSVTAFTLDGDALAYEDKCEGENLYEQSCMFNSNSSNAQQRLVNCEFGCSNGVCLNESDAKNIMPTPPPNQIITVLPTSTPFPSPIFYTPYEQWKGVQTQEFGVQMRIPDNCSLVPEQGVDSVVGSVQCPDFTLMYDIGNYSGNPADNLPQNSTSTIEYETIDTRNSEVVVPLKYPDVIGVYFSDINNSDGELQPKFSMSANIFNNHQKEVIFQIFQSLDFRD